MRVGPCFFSIALAIALSGCADRNVDRTASAGTNPVDESRLKRYFAIMDQDQDGFISRPEFQTERGAVFLVVDRNNSFTLTSDEMQLTPEAFRQLAGANEVVEIGELFSSTAISFDKVDASEDKRISYGEFSTFILHFGS